MLWNRFDMDKPYLNHFANPVMDPDSGIVDMDELKQKLLAMAEELRHLPHPIAKARMFQYVVQNIALQSQKLVRRKLRRAQALPR